MAAYPIRSAIRHVNIEQGDLNGVSDTASLKTLKFDLKAPIVLIEDAFES